MPSGFLHGVVRENLTAEEVASAVAALPLTGSGRIQVQGGRGGTSIGLAENVLRLTDFRLAVLASEGPGGEDDFEDERYWTIAARPDRGAVDDVLSPVADKANYPDDWWVPASNLSEWAAGGGTHTLAVDGTRLVVLFRLVDQADNERFVFDVTPPNPFPVKVEKDGGTNGDATHPASYTYTVRSLAGTELGTAVPLARPRPDGTVTFQAGADGYGLAFYDGTDLKLWDAGEIPGTGSCA